MLPALLGDKRQGPQLSQPVYRNAVVVFDRRHAVLPDGRHGDVVAAGTKLACNQPTLDLRAADVRRVVICRQQDPESPELRLRREVDRRPSRGPIDGRQPAVHRAFRAGG